MQRRIPACEVLAVMHAIWIVFAIDIHRYRPASKHDRKFTAARRIGVAMMRKRGYAMSDIARVLGMARTVAYECYNGHLKSMEGQSERAKTYRARNAQARKVFENIVTNGLWAEVVNKPKKIPSYYVFPGLP